MNETLSSRITRVELKRMQSDYRQARISSRACSYCGRLSCPHASPVGHRDPVWAKRAV